MEYIKRTIQDHLLKHLSNASNEILLLSGARQTGKSTIVENLPCKEEKTIINLWDEEREIIALRNARTFSEFETILKTVFGFRSGTGKILIIDEAQASEHISSFIMEMYRKWKGQKVILLGSLLANLYKKGQPMPVGRTIEYICRPLSFREFMRFRKKEDYFDLIQEAMSQSRELHDLFMDEYRFYLQIGGLPGIVSADYDNQYLTLLFESLLGNIYRDADRYISQEKTTHSGRTPQYGRILETVMKSIAHHLTAPTQNTTLLSSDSPAYRYILPLILEALSSWHLAYTIPFQTAQHSTKKGYSSKKYLFDTGIANFLLTRLMPVQFGLGDQTAAMLLENAVMQDLVSSTMSINAIQCYHTNNRVQSELDFVARKGAGTIPIEVKSSSQVKRQTLNQLIEYMTRFNVEEGYVVYTDVPKTEVIHDKTVHFIPPYLVGEILR